MQRTRLRRTVLKANNFCGSHTHQDDNLGEDKGVAAKATISLRGNSGSMLPLHDGRPRLDPPEQAYTEGMAKVITTSSLAVPAPTPTHACSLAIVCSMVGISFPEAHMAVTWQDLGFNFPMFLSCLGLVFASGFSIVIVHCTNLIQLEHTSRYGRHKDPSHP
jgi:hypothetical protein